MGNAHLQHDNRDDNSAMPANPLISANPQGRQTQSRTCYNTIVFTMRKFERLRHIRYFTNSLQKLPKQYSSADTNRLTLVHFCVQALDILGCLPDANCCGKVEEEVNIHREAIIEWIYGLQTVPTIETDKGSNTSHYVGGGFKGGTFLGPLPNPSSTQRNEMQCINEQTMNEYYEQQHPYDHSHLAMTYVAICTLVSLGDDLSRCDKTAILQTLQSLQKVDGSFVAISSNNNNNNCNKKASIDDETEDDDCDLRFMYTAIVIWYLLKPPSNIDDAEETIINIDAATSYILSCISYDGALGLTPGREGHGGSTFCGIASLYLMGVLDDVMAREELRGWKETLIQWCVKRQFTKPRIDSENNEQQNVFYNGESNNAAGMQGRPNKLQDTCYSYWIGECFGPDVDIVHSQEDFLSCIHVFFHHLLLFSSYWIGGTLHILSESHLLDGWALREYVLTCQSPYGGFGKVVGAMVNPYFSLLFSCPSRCA